jgi:hypothetical protein
VVDDNCRIATRTRVPEIDEGMAATASKVPVINRGKVRVK